MGRGAGWEGLGARAQRYCKSFFLDILRERVRERVLVRVLVRVAVAVAERVCVRDAERELVFLAVGSELLDGDTDWELETLGARERVTLDVVEGRGLKDCVQVCDTEADWELLGVELSVLLALAVLEAEDDTDAVPLEDADDDGEPDTVAVRLAVREFVAVGVDNGVTEALALGSGRP